MGAITKIAGRTLTETSGTTLPDTLTDPGPGCTIPRDAYNYVLHKFVLPMLMEFDGGRKLTVEDSRELQPAYVEGCVGFMPEAYPLALSMMRRERDDRWRPTVAECRNKWLPHAENEVCARMGRPVQVRGQERLKTAMYRMLEEDDLSPQPKPRLPWDPATLGPMPTEHGCRLDAATRSEVWRAYFGHGFDGERGTPEMHVRTRAVHLAALGIAVSPPTCPILQAVMAERGVRMTSEDSAGIDRAVEEYRARRADKVAASREIEAARARREAEERKWERQQGKERDRHVDEELKRDVMERVMRRHEVIAARDQWEESAHQVEDLRAYHGALDRAQAAVLERLCHGQPQWAARMLAQLRSERMEELNRLQVRLAEAVIAIQQ